MTKNRSVYEKIITERLISDCKYFRVRITFFHTTYGMTKFMSIIETVTGTILETSGMGNANYRIQKEERKKMLKRELIDFLESTKSTKYLNYIGKGE